MHSSAFLKPDCRPSDCGIAIVSLPEKKYCKGYLSCAVSLPAKQNREKSSDIRGSPLSITTKLHWLVQKHYKLAGIYIHIPFCKKACHYCNFHFSTSLKLKNELLDALLKEIRLTPGKKDALIETVYFGGGTPSILDMEEIKKILSELGREFRISPDAEVTLEANPDDITREKANAWLEAGINRLSIGIQSFREKDLEWMNRSHSAQQARTAIEDIKMAGFTNYSIDLIFGTPGLGTEAWEDNIREALALEIPHLSCYALTVEPKTALDKMIALHKKEAPDPDLQAEQYLLLMDRLTEAGYEHYEISSFALPGMQSRHNRSYWQGKAYFGFGPAAHSFDGNCRKWNIANNADYIRSLATGRIPFESETLSRVQQLNEYIMTSLRTSGGINLEYITGNWNELISLTLEKKAGPYLKSGKIARTGNSLLLTREGKLFADGIASDLFMDEI
jgi:oxygen-independent coproporphyrinogen-3 oxidase